MIEEKRNKIVWITGASSGIGKSIASEFVKNGIRVAATARREENLHRIKDQLPENKDLFEIYPGDITDLAAITKTYSKIINHHKIDAIINNAGVTTFKSVGETSFDEVKSIVDTNLTSTICLTKTVLPHMIDNKGGSIINILSVAAQIVFRNSSVYAATKAGIKAFSDSLREEVREDNIRVINIFPGATRTPMWPNSALEKYSSRMMSPDDIAKIICELYLVKSSAVPEEIRLKPMLGDL